MARGRYVKEPGAKTGYYLPCPVCHHKVCSCVEDRLLAELDQAGIPRPPERQFPFSDDRAWKADFAYPSYHLIVEVEGGGGKGRHTSVTGYRADMVKYNVMSLLGWRLLRFDKQMIVDGTAVKTIWAALNGTVFTPLTKHKQKRLNLQKTPKIAQKSTKTHEKSRKSPKIPAKRGDLPGFSQAVPDDRVTDPVEIAIRAAKRTPVVPEDSPEKARPKGPRS